MKVSNDLEIYEIDQPSKEKLEEICDLRQPVLFDYLNERLINDCDLNIVANNYGAFDVKVRNNTYIKEENELYLPFTMKAATEVFKNDNKSLYFSEKNQDFLQETGIIKTFRYNDLFLRPNMVSNCEYDFLFGSNNCTTPLRYNLNYRNYFLNTGNEITIKLIPPVYNKYLYVQSDYDNFEFISNINVWDVQQQYKADFDKVKSLEINLKKGQMIYIPAYWFYSLKFKNDSSLCFFGYKTYMNTVSIVNHLFMNFLQRHNIKREMFKKLNLSETINMELDQPADIIYSIDDLLPKKIVNEKVNKYKLNETINDNSDAKSNNKSNEKDEL